MTEQNNTTNSLAHTKWNCKYHIVFAPKYRRKVFYAEKREDIREIIQTLCQWKGVEIIEGEVCPDHIHLLLSIPPKLSVSGFMNYLKGKSVLMMFHMHAINTCVCGILLLLPQSCFEHCFVGPCPPVFTNQQMNFFHSTMNEVMKYQLQSTSQPHLQETPIIEYKITANIGMMLISVIPAFALSASATEN